MLTVRCAGRSDRGRKRSSNEDTLVLRPDLGLVAVADGMGGAASGELASSIFMEETLRVFSDGRHRTGQTADLVEKAFSLANERVFKEAHGNPSHSGMGCTAELLAIDGRSYVIGHVGDSRTYLLRSGKLRQITRDHSIVQEQIDRGLITQEEARTHSLRNVIMRAVGVSETLAIDLIQGRSQLGDLFLVCSDGLTDMVEDEVILECLSHPSSLDEKAESLVESANLAGGYDNITVVLWEITE
jgi:PPM family protein phosphatase